MYAAGLVENKEYLTTCPCTGSGTSPAFVGSDYYCEAGLNNPPWQSVLYFNDTLWDGHHCNGLMRTCCDPPNLPCFCKELPEPTTDDLEFRLCGNQAVADEDVPVDLAELYIQ